MTGSTKRLIAAAALATLGLGASPALAWDDDNLAPDSRTMIQRGGAEGTTFAELFGLFGGYDPYYHRPYYYGRPYPRVRVRFPDHAYDYRYHRHAPAYRRPHLSSR